MAIISVALPDKLHTDGGLSGANARIRVDPGQTGFFAGRMFRSLHEFNIPASGSLTLRFVSTVNFILWGQRIEIDAGAVRIENIIGGTASGTWNAMSVPPIGRNRMTEVPNYPAVPVTNITATQGGTVAGGSVVDILRIRAAANQGVSHSSNVGPGQEDERGLPPGAYFIKLTSLTSTEASTGVCYLSWEER